MQTKVFTEMRDALPNDKLHEIAMNHVHSNKQTVRKDVAALYEDDSLDILIKDSDYEVRMIAASAGRIKDLNSVLKDASRQVKIEYIKNADLSCITQFLKYNKSDILSAIVDRKITHINKDILDRVIKDSKQSKPSLVSSDLISSLISYDNKFAEELYLNLDKRYYNLITNSARNIPLTNISEKLLNTIIRYSENKYSIEWAKRHLSSSK